MWISRWLLTTRRWVRCLQGGPKKGNDVNATTISFDAFDGDGDLLTLTPKDIGIVNAVILHLDMIKLRVAERNAMPFPKDGSEMTELAEKSEKIFTMWCDAEAWLRHCSKNIALIRYTVGDDMTTHDLSRTTMDEYCSTECAQYMACERAAEMLYNIQERLYKAAGLLDDED